MQEKTKEKIKQLIERYKKLSNKEIKDYNEQQTKDHFIRPLFEALGWDFLSDVWSETGIQGKRVDYAFMINGNTKFLVEAKPLRADLDIETHAKQAIKYAWNKGIAWAILTDFENIKVFNAQTHSKSLLDKLVFEISYNEYLSDFERLYLLSKESFKNNALDEYAVRHGKKLKKLTVNEKLFNDLKEVRKELTYGFGEWDKTIDRETLEEGVQRIIERLMFIRVLEDKGLEDPVLIPILREWENNHNKQLFPKLITKFRELDDIYNSNIFKKHACEDWEEYGVKWNKIFSLLYGSHVYEYDFKEIPADILGGVYESYLSYIAQNPIEIETDKKSSKLFKAEDKKELKEKSRKKRKEQGIFYTPQFIVDYIVENTVGKKLQEVKSMHELKQIKILDPACGSGSFLTKALRAVNEKYIDFGNPGGQATKSEILLSNIYGVDLDPKAVELAKLNLLVEALDKKAKLPDLTENIRVGNSLISGEEKELKKYFGKNWRDKRPFNWEEEFKRAFKQGGFDVVIGNPPWGANIDEETKYLGEKYPDSTKAHKDIYKIFIDKAIGLLKSDGILGFIVPNTFLYQPRYQDIKDVIDQYENLVINLGEHIFSNVQLPSCIFILRKKKGNNKIVIDLTKIKREELPGAIINTTTDSAIKISAKAVAIVKNTGLTFDEVFLMKDAGINYQAVKVGKAEKGKSELGKLLFYEGKKENKNDVEYWKGSNIERYFIQNKTEQFVKTDYKKFKKDNERVILNSDFFTLTPKILWRQTASCLIATVDEKGVWFGRSIIGAIIKPEFKNKVNIYFALSIFNSKYIDFIYRQKVLETGKVFPQVKLKYLRNLPFVVGTKSQQAKVAELAKKMLDLNKTFQSLPENSEKWNSVKKEIEKTDKEIDKKVYELYGLTGEERKVVENN